MITKTKIKKINKIPVLLAFASICGMTIFRNNNEVLVFLDLLLIICTLWNIVGIIREYGGFTAKHLMLVISLLVTITIMIVYWVIKD